MSARQLLRAILLLQGALAIMLASALVYAQLIAAWPLALLASLALVLLARLLISANNFRMAARFASPTPDSFKLGLAAQARLFGEEFMASMLHASWFMARATACERIYDDAVGPPVLLVHGYGCNSGYWAHLTPLLDAARISHATVDLEPVLGAIDGYVPLVARAIDSLRARTGAARVIIVAHSMGGLVARAYLRAHGAARVAHVFTLGTPHHGTSLARRGIGRNAAQMRRDDNAVGVVPASAPECAWLRALGASETAATRALITSFYTHHDNIVAPQTSSELPGARNVQFGGVGHVAMGRNRTILTRLLHEIATISSD